jgi:hypothetical protein
MNCHTNRCEEINFLPLAWEIHERMRLSHVVNVFHDSNCVCSAYNFNELYNGRKWNVLYYLKRRNEFINIHWTILIYATPELRF